MSLRQLIVAQIKANIPTFKQVEGAADLSNIIKSNISDDGCYVFIEGDKAGKNILVSPSVCQEVEEVISIIISVKNLSGQRQTNADDDLDVFKGELHDSLLGFEPTGYDPVTYAGGKLMSLSKGFLLFKAQYRTSSTINSI